MSAVGGVATSNQVSGLAGVGGGGLSPDSVMLYCAAQLNQLDDKIQQHMAQQQVARGQQEKLGKLKALLAGDMSGGAAEQKKQIMEAMKEAYDSLPANDSGRDQLNKLFHDFITTASFSDSGADRVASGDAYNLFNLTDDKMNYLAGQTGDKNFVSDSEMKGFAARVDPVLSDIGKGAELEMINLQSMVSQRQMAVQMATQMIAKMNETQISIISGMK
jgi:hypothetical protein